MRSSVRPIWVTQRNMDPWIALPSNGQLPHGNNQRFHAHQLLETLDFRGFHADTTLTLRPALEIVDGHPLAPNFQLADPTMSVGA